jgi:hypothetical protein
MDKLQSAAEVISSLFEHISAEQVQNADTTLAVWKKILLSVDEKKIRRDGQKSYTGENLYYHSKVVDRKNGILLIETDHPGWIQLFQMHQSYIVRGFKKFAPELHITSLCFRLSGQRAEIFDRKAPNTRETRKKAHLAQKRGETPTNADKDFTPAPTEAQQKELFSALPEELKQIFAKIRENSLDSEK